LGVVEILAWAKEGEDEVPDARKEMPHGDGECRTVRALGLEYVREFLPFEEAMAWTLEERLCCIDCGRDFEFGDARCEWDPEPPAIEVVLCPFIGCDGTLLDFIPEKLATGVFANES